jgi:hypothetical protein
MVCTAVANRKERELRAALDAVFRSYSPLGARIVVQGISSLMALRLDFDLW